MGPPDVATGHAGCDQIARMGEVAKQSFDQKLVPLPVVEAFDKAALHRPAWRDAMPFNCVLRTPLQDVVEGQFRPAIADDHRRFAAPFDQRRQLPGQALA